MPLLSSSRRLAPRFLLASLLFAAAALTGCNAAPALSANDTLPSFLSTSHDNGEPISTLGANYSLPSGSHHASRLHDVPGQNYAHSNHRAL